MRVQGKLFHPMLHHIEAMRWIYIYLLTAIRLATGGQEEENQNLMYMNMSSINWCSKKKSTMEKSVFDTKFVSMKDGMDAWNAIRYIRIIGIPISELGYINEDDMSVININLKLESTLEKECRAMAYHAIH